MSRPDAAAGARATRHLPIAQRLTGLDHESLIRKFRKEPVLITGEPARLQTRSGRLMVRLLANLSARFCQRIHLALEDGPEGMGIATEQLIQRIDREAEVQRLRAPDVAAYAGVVSVGSGESSSVLAPNVTTIDAAGWVATVSNSGRIPSLLDSGDGNPFGALAAATLGTAELFKRLVKPRPEKAGFFGDTMFSTYDYGVGKADPGPALPATIALPPSLLAGAGAVGNAFLLALSEIAGLRGAMAVVDSGLLDDASNLNRYVMADESDLNIDNPMPKTSLAHRLFAGSPVAIQRVDKDVADISGEIQTGSLTRPVVVVSALDNNPARHTLQDLWPDLLIEGATGETVAQVSRHAYAEGLACLKCIHPPPRKSAGTYEERLQRISGLPLAWLRAAQQNPDLPLDTDAVGQAGEEYRRFLAPLVGKPACSVLSEIERLSSRPAGELPFQPTVSFVSMMAGLLAAAEMVKFAAGLPTPLRTFFQVDLMFPLHTAFLQPVQKVTGCYCLERKDVIARYRQAVGYPPPVGNAPNC